jgi:hypothetical protein
VVALTVWVRPLAVPAGVNVLRLVVNVAFVARWIVKLVGSLAATQLSVAVQFGPVGLSAAATMKFVGAAGIAGTGTAVVHGTKADVAVEFVAAIWWR